jgi:hypothetical protein
LDKIKKRQQARSIEQMLSKTKILAAFSSFPTPRLGVFQIFLHQSVNEKKTREQGGGHGYSKYESKLLEFSQIPIRLNSLPN